MSETYQFNLPLVAAAQSQKHVTVNEALARLDVFAQLRLMSLSVTSPPGGELDGQAWFVPSGGAGDWAGHGGEIAVFSNGGWVFLPPKAGWQAWVEYVGARYIFEFGAWQVMEQVRSSGGALTQFRIAEMDHTLSTGATSTTSNLIPANALVTGVTARVITDITGSGVTSWSLGVSGSDNRYGSSLGLAQNSYAHGLTGSPLTYYSDTPLILTAVGGNFSGGEVRLAVHYTALVPPQTV